ncbi:MAG: TetR/AcrR family transcriptional regulator [Ruminococcaceae bacterium]|nr:TetR/AcrR family transcriptional regulator [Oscillospiraceae bacterium]
MNTKNNRRRRDSVEKIERAFIELLQTKELKDISVTDICKETGLNRSTFYSNYLDVYDLADKVIEKIEGEFFELFDHKPNEKDGAVIMFTHIKENQLFFKTYFKLNYDEKHTIYNYDTERARRDFGDKNIKYHIEFFRNGLNAIIKLWLAGGCEESPEEIAEILKQEYRGR